MKRQSKDYPVYKVKNFYSTFWYDRQKVINSCLDNFRYRNPWAGDNAPIIDDHTGFFSKLYKKYYNFCLKKFKFNVHPDNTGTCWVYISNGEFHSEHYHDHAATGCINSVFYLETPENETAINFAHSLNEDSPFVCKVRENDLVINPSNLLHCPSHFINSYDWVDNKHRIAINMEIKCLESPEELFSRLKH